MAAFHDVLFPLQLGYGTTGGPEFSTQVVVTGSGHEQRNSQWSDARLYYDAGVGVRSEADLSSLITFFRARRGQAHGFRFSDPLDRNSALSGALVAATDQLLGTGDGGTTRFALLKQYGDSDDPQSRRITRPVAGSVRIAVAGVTRPSGWSLAAGGQIDFEIAPVAGAVVTAGFEFDVPVRFAADRIDVSLAGWRCRRKYRWSTAAISSRPAAAASGKAGMEPLQPLMVMAGFSRNLLSAALPGLSMRRFFRSMVAAGPQAAGRYQRLKSRVGPYWAPVRPKLPNQSAVVWLMSKTGRRFRRC